MKDLVFGRRKTMLEDQEGGVKPEYAVMERESLLTCELATCLPIERVRDGQYLVGTELR